MQRLLSLLSLTLVFFLLSSHELFIKSDSYFLRKASSAEIYLYNGTFDQSENVITRDRIISPQILGPDYHFVPSPKDYYDRDSITFLTFKTGGEGTYLAGISTKPRMIELSGKKFTEYLLHEGLTKVIEDREKRGISGEAAKEKYAKHVKAILQVEEKKTDHYSKELGYPIEFIPLKNPYELSVGEAMSFQLLYLGKPLSDQIVHFSSRQHGVDREATETSLLTNKNGELSFLIDHPGQWYVATIHMMESEEEGVDYESQWATLTFEVK